MLIRHFLQVKLLAPPVDPKLLGRFSIPP